MTTTAREGERLLEGMVSLVQDTYSDTTTAGDGRGLARLEEALYQRHAPGRIRGVRMLVAAIATVALVVGGTAVFRSFDAVTYQVMNGSIGPGGFVRPTATGTTIVFSEGSEISLGASARTRVDGLTADGGRVVVESGSVHARITPRKRARWSVEAGPYSIRVTGTAFNVKWSWTNELLDIQMDHGSVIVTGPLAPAGVTLTAGMRLTANPRSGLAIGGGTASGGADSRRGLAAAMVDEPREDGVADAAESAPPQVEPGLGLADKPRGVGAAVRQKAVSAAAHHGADRRQGGGLSASETSVPSSETWDRQLARGHFQAILDDAEARGIDRVLANVSGRDLSALADAARYGHRPALARRTLLSMRDRFPRSSEARDAAFFLGGLAEDAAGASGHGDALNWYQQYLGESSRGRYAAQALGRKMVMTQKLKGAEAAGSVAGEYLERFPDGPYAAAARKLLRER